MYIDIYVYACVWIYIHIYKHMCIYTFTFNFDECWRLRLNITILSQHWFQCSIKREGESP